MEMKVCSKCGESKPATTDYFYVHKKTKGGLQSYCKDCAKKAAAKDYKKNGRRRKSRTDEMLKRDQKKMLNEKVKLKKWLGKGVVWTTSGAIREHYGKVVEVNKRFMVVKGNYRECFGLEAILTGHSNIKLCE